MGLLRRMGEAMFEDAVRRTARQAAHHIVEYGLMRIPNYPYGWNTNAGLARKGLSQRTDWVQVDEHHFSWKGSPYLVEIPDSKTLSDVINLVVTIETREVMSDLPMRRQLELLDMASDEIKKYLSSRNLSEARR